MLCFVKGKDLFWTIIIIMNTLNKATKHHLGVPARMHSPSGGSLRLRSVQRLSVVEVLFAPALHVRMPHVRASATIPHAKNIGRGQRKATKLRQKRNRDNRVKFNFRSTRAFALKKRVKPVRPLLEAKCVIMERSAHH
jgi:hypothetical protein